ncbi:hypothetical protein P7K49_024642, partial [Saguinus oedipus]
MELELHDFSQAQQTAISNLKAGELFQEHRSQPGSQSGRPVLTRHVSSLSFQDAPFQN